MCSTCGRSVPRQNVELYKARCDQHQAKVNMEEPEVVGTRDKAKQAVCR